MIAMPPFRADHVGSLLRPRALLAARAAFAHGDLDAETLRHREDEAIREAIRMQEEVGLAAASDGEMRRGSWHMDFLSRIDGVEKISEQLPSRYQTAEGTFETKTLTAIEVRGRLSLSETIFSDAFAFLAKTTRVVPKLSIPSPSMLHFRAAARIDRTIYPDAAQFVDDLAAVYADEIARLGEMGCRYLQLDDTSLAMLNDPAQRERVRTFGGDPERQHVGLYRAHQQGAGAPSCRDDGMHAYVPRQLPLRLDGRGQLRACGRGAVLGAQRRRLLHGV
jgi:5-methyltetrahydropteroyltriglutamate--homocysteine methyltransferase